MKKKDEIIWTIKELYEWACENKCEEMTVFTNDEGVSCNIYTSNIIINTKEKHVCL